MRKKVFVTGGGGFIGSHLVEKLVKDGYSVKTIVPYNIDNSCEHFHKWSLWKRSNACSWPVLIAQLAWFMHWKKFYM